MDDFNYEESTDDPKIHDIENWIGGKDVSSWSKTTELSVSYAGDNINFYFDEPSNWDGDGATCSDFFVVFKKNGGWIAQNTDFLRCSSNKHAKSIIAHMREQPSIFPMNRGDQVGYIVTSWARDGYSSGVQERSNLYMTTWP